MMNSFLAAKYSAALLLALLGGNILHQTISNRPLPNGIFGLGMVAIFISSGMPFVLFCVSVNPKADLSLACWLALMPLLLGIAILLIRRLNGGGRFHATRPLLSAIGLAGAHYTLSNVLPLYHIKLYPTLVPFSTGAITAFFLITTATLAYDNLSDMRRDAQLAGVIMFYAFFSLAIPSTTGGFRVSFPLYSLASTGLGVCTILGLQQITFFRHIIGTLLSLVLLLAFCGFQGLLNIAKAHNLTSILLAASLAATIPATILAGLINRNQEINSVA